MSKLKFLVTGGSQGIGEAVVELAREAGHDVVFTGRNEKRIRAVADRTGADGMVADIASEEDNARTVRQCLDSMGGIDVLINNAGYAYRAAIGEIDMGALRANFDVNVFGLVDLTNRIVPMMKEKQFGTIINIASTSGLKGSAGGTSYGGTKWALRGITQCWQQDLRPSGIRVTCVCPSEVQTNFGGRTGRDNPNKLYAVDIAQTIMAAIDMPHRALWPELAVFANNPWKED